MTRIVGLGAAALIFGVVASMWVWNARPETIRATVERVIDGDTLELDGRRVRLWGIDAPPRHDAEGRRATAFLEGLTRGRTLRCEVRSWQGATERYRERAIARCYLGADDLARSLLDAGHVAVNRRHAGSYYD